MNIVKPSLLLIAFSISVATHSKKITSCPFPDYMLVWHDEFSSSKLDSTRWTYQVANAGWVNHELQTYVKAYSPKGREVAKCKKGTLRIYTFREDD